MLRMFQPATTGLVWAAYCLMMAAKTVPLLVPANAEIILEGWVHPGETAPEGPFEVTLAPTAFTDRVDLRHHGAADVQVAVHDTQGRIVQ